MAEATASTPIREIRRRWWRSPAVGAGGHRRGGGTGVLLAGARPVPAAGDPEGSLLDVDLVDGAHLAVGQVDDRPGDIVALDVLPLESMHQSRVHAIVVGVAPVLVVAITEDGESPT